MTASLFDTAAFDDRASTLRLSEAGRAAAEQAREVVGQPREPLSDKDAKKLLPLYERGLADLRSGADEVVLYRHDLGRNFAFTGATLGGLEQGLRNLRIQLRLETAATPKRRFA